MNRRLNVAVLMGGPSMEREVSLRSGTAVVGALSDAGMNVTAVDVRGPHFALPANTDVAFVALHGTFGEDGGVQQVLEARGVRYTGSGVQASALAFDKSAAKGIFQAHGVPSPRGVTLTKGDPVASLLEAMSLPLVVKPSRQGSSVGVHLVRDQSELAAACADAWRYDAQIVIEDFVKGRELTVGLFDGVALPVIEVRPRGEVFTYDAKYTKGATEYLVPAPITSAKILKGGNTAATDYFKAKTSSQLTNAFKPVIADSMNQVGATRSYKALTDRYNSMVPFGKMDSFDLDSYVTQKSLDGMFLKVGQEEAKIRTNPAARTTDLLKKVFAK